MTKKYPACKQDNADNDYQCRGCGTQLNDDRIIINNMDSPIQVKDSKSVDYFKIEDFLQQNFQFFTIIGVIGTMVILLPNLGERIIGSDWMNSNFSFLSIFIILSNFGGGFLLLLISISLIKKIGRGRDDEDTKCNLKIFKIKKGDTNRFIMLSCLLTLMGSIVYFIIIATFLIPYPPAFLISILIILFLLIIVVISLFYTIISEIKRGLEINSKFDKVDLIAQFVVSSIVIIFIFGVILYPALNSIFLPQSPHDVKIQVDQEYYSPLISTTPGIKLVTTNSTNIGTFYPQYEITAFHWMTNYGYFVRQDPYTSKIFLLNCDTLQPNNQNIYWTFSKGNLTTEKIPVQINLVIYNPTTWTIITNSSLNITWTDQGFAKVQ